MTFDTSEMLLDGLSAAIEESELELNQEQMNRIMATIENAIPGTIERMTYATADVWRQLAMDAGGWGTKYAKIIRATFDGAEGNIFLDESMMDAQSKKPNMMFAMMMERGVQSWSIKDALMASDKAKTGKDGVKYITIPMPVATPRKKGQGHMMSKFGGREMSSDIHKLVKAGGTAPAGTTITTSTAHKDTEVSIAGLTRYNTRQRHSQYGIFRRVSERSSGWQYPSIGSTPIFNTVKDYVEKGMRDAIKTFCEAVVAEYK